MKTLRATAAVLLFTSGVAAAPASAQSTGPGVQFGRAGAVAAAPQRPGHYSGPRAPAPIGGPGWSRDDGWWGGDRPRHPCGKRRRCRDREYYGYGYGGIGHDRMIAGGAEGYFTQEGNQPAMVNGRPRYDYDRGYAYEYYRAEPRVQVSEGRREHSARSRDCSTEWTRDRRSGQQVAVRVCRN